MNNYPKLQSVLKELFEIDKADLDFGIYRIMNQKRAQVMDFIDHKLPADIKAILASTQSKDATSIQAELDKAIKNAQDLGVDPNTLPKVIELKTQIANAIDTNALEQEVFSHLASFFKRYYKDGDFISLRRYKKDVYAIPYEGEEVKLHWANADQYYIKTSEYLKNYAFKLKDGKKVHFQLKEATTEQNNNKTQGDAERRFALYTELPAEEIDGELYINFTYEPHPKSVKQNDLSQAAFTALQTAIPANFQAFVALFDKAPTESNKNRTLLEKHLNDFISRNSFDYFIHKDLGGFLNRELDFYIKNEVLYIDDINTEQPEFFTAQLSKIKALKTVAQKIISFLAQIEDFQKKLWLKKKFVLRTDYCITLDRIPEKYYQEIIENNAQLEEWKTLFGVVNVQCLMINGKKIMINDQSLMINEDLMINEKAENTLFPEAEAPLNINHSSLNIKKDSSLNIKKDSSLNINHSSLIIDTKFFSDDFKDRLLGEFDNLDENTNGLLINSENFQALNLLQEKYKEEVDVVYIDPPYNTGNDGFIYKDGLGSSSWLTMIENRIRNSIYFLNECGVSFTSIDDNELSRLMVLFDSLFSKENFIAKFDWRKKTGANDAKDIAVITESILLFAKNKSKTISNNIWARDKESINQNRYSKTDDFIETRGKFYYDTLDRGGLQYSDSLNFGIEAPDGGIIFPNGRSEFINDGWIWKWSKDKVKWGLENDFLEFIESDKSDGSKFTIKYKVYQNVDNEGKIRENVGRAFTNLITEPINQQGNSDLLNVFGGLTPFSNPKPVKLILNLEKIINGSNSLILDYFAGSGTTGHATIKLNREDGGKRKYILVEMGSYFDTVTKPRIQKVIYTDNWKNGLPQDTQGISQMFKYQVLESYEDTLNNLTLKTTTQDLFSPAAQEEYLLQYMLEVESREQLLNIALFRNPFNYQLNATENNELVPTRVDLVETFNYLIGLYVDRIQRVNDIKLVEGKTRTGEKTLVIWRNLDTTDNAETQRVFRKLYDSVRSAEFDQIYINGDNNFDNFRIGEDVFKVKLIEEAFFKLMFND